ncbi:MAG: helix-hairpin-helix domain-containing protein [Fimbriimonadales bacterium]|nr:helix-hairpin-helix domain-containing protein [Fimbriimonadales bacterium]
MHSIWEKLEWKERTTLLGIYAASIGLALSLGYGWGRSGAEPLATQIGGLEAASTVEVIDLSKTDPAPATPMPSTADPPVAPQELVVHVSGAVKKAGVYRLGEGSRVADAIEQAGGASENADLDALNLAEPLTDGQKVHVPRKGEAPPATAVAATPSTTARPERAAKPAVQFPIDLNTATAEQLEAIPGIGPVLAQRIVDHRRLHGKFQSVDDLLQVHGIGQKRLESMRPYVTVK